MKISYHTHKHTHTHPTHTHTHKAVSRPLSFLFSSFLEKSS